MRDQELLLSRGQAITATAFSTDVYDQGGARDPGAGEDVYAEVRVVQAFNTLTSLDIQIVTSATEDMASHVVVSTMNVLLAGLTVNTMILRMALPVGNRLRYLSFRYVVNGTAPTLGTIEATLARHEIPKSFTNAVA